MPVPRRRHSKSRSGSARAHKKLHPPQTLKCGNCGETRLPHRICQNCGQYQGRSYKTIVTT
jgi:large subunit ribosomal protein L32